MTETHDHLPSPEMLSPDYAEPYLEAAFAVLAVHSESVPHGQTETQDLRAVNPSISVSLAKNESGTDSSKGRISVDGEDGIHHLVSKGKGLMRREDILAIHQWSSEAGNFKSWNIQRWKHPFTGRVTYIRSSFRSGGGRTVDAEEGKALFCSYATDFRAALIDKLADRPDLLVEIDKLASANLQRNRKSLFDRALGWLSLKRR